MKVAELRDALRAAGLATGGRKAELVARLEEVRSGEEANGAGDVASEGAGPPEGAEEAQEGVASEGAGPPEGAEEAEAGVAAESEGCQAGGTMDVDARDDASDAAPQRPATAEGCPYLDTIARAKLDFDFEQVCSVSVANHNVYACLVCGRFFAGRAERSPAYYHALEEGHHVFMHLGDERCFCLPDGYEVRDPSLADVRQNLHPRFDPAEVRAGALDRARRAVAVDGTAFLPGVVGLNNLKRTDWFSAVLQALARVRPLRDFFAVEANYERAYSGAAGQGGRHEVVRRFGELVRKMFNPRAFRGHVSPHALMVAVEEASRRRFRAGKAADPLQFLAWLMHRLHEELGGGRAPGSSVVHEWFQGEVRVRTRRPVLSAEELRKTAPASAPAAPTAAAAAAAAAKEEEDGDGPRYSDAEERRVPFLYLSLDLPPARLFKDTEDRSLIPQVPLAALLEKFRDGAAEERQPDGSLRAMRLVRLPRYLVLHYRRFSRNSWFAEKNPTLVGFPLRGLDMAPYAEGAALPPRDELARMPVPRLRELMDARGLDHRSCVEKGDMVARLLAAAGAGAKYDLVANVVHEGTPADGAFRAHVRHEGTGTWYSVQDLGIETSDTMAEQVALSETFMQVYERQ